MPQDEGVPELSPPPEADQPASQEPQEKPEPPAAPETSPAPTEPQTAPEQAPPPKPGEPVTTGSPAEETEAAKEEVKLPGQGEIVEATVRRLAPFGAFVRLSDGRKGLIHISQIAEEFVNEIKDHLKVGQTVRARITAVSDDGKVDLSIKKAQPRPKPERPPRPKRRKRPERDQADTKLPKQTEAFHVNPLADVFGDVEKKLK